MRGGVQCVAAMLAAGAMLAPGMARARDPEQVARIPLAPMGYQEQLTQFLLGGSTMLTVHFVDRDHLLITFGLRQLMKREPNDPPDDDDRLVGAELVELPSGKVLAQTQWRMHDRGQYLWSLGHGQFLLRIRDQLSAIAPMQGVGKGDAFRQRPLLHFDHNLVALQVSADGDLLTVETNARTQGNAGVATDVTVVDPGHAAPAPIQITFYRIRSTGDGMDNLVLSSAGTIGARSPVDIPMTTAGFLDVIESGKNSWFFNFDEHAGKVDELAEWDTTCFPQSTFIGHSEFVAIGCRGGADRQSLAGFNLKGEQMWQQNFLETQTALTYSFAPAGGRFALGRILVKGPFDPEGTLTADAVSQQEVRVVQSYDGKLVFRIDCSPVQRAGQNFALSEDGMRLAVVRETTVHHAATKDYDAYTENEAAVEVYALPPLSDQDKAAVKQAAADAPKDTGARIDTSLERISATVEKSAETASSETGGAALTISTTGSGAVTGPPSTTGGDSSAQVAASLGEQSAPLPAGAVVLGDPEPGTGRKRPTLYGPDETPAEKATPQ